LGNGENGTKVQLWDCNGQQNQKWDFDVYGRLVNEEFSTNLHETVLTPIAIIRW